MRHLLSYLPYAGLEPYPSAFKHGSYEEMFDSRAEADARLQALVSEGRVERAEIYQEDERYPFGRKLVFEHDYEKESRP